MAVELYREFVPQMIELYNSGKDPWSISLILGIHHQTINDYLRKEGVLPPKQRKRTSAKFTLTDAWALRASLRVGDQIEYMAQIEDVEGERLIIPIKQKLHITGIYRRGITVTRPGEVIKYRFISYKDLLLSGQQKKVLKTS